MKSQSNLSTANANTDNPLGIAPIGSLLAKFAIPAIISMLVNALYNIVDQIFIGQGVGMREFDTLKSKKVPQSLEIGLFFCQIFIFII